MSITDIYVKDVYDKIAKEFDNTRYSVWNCVKSFLDDIPKHSVIGDIGCGNGKNMMYRKDCINIGCDFSVEFVKICNNKNLNVVYGDILELPFENDMFDYTICIAVIHHLSTLESRKKAISELKRVTKSGGKILILVWALEQPDDSKRKFTEQENLVQWIGPKGNVEERYYYVFRQGELEELVDDEVICFNEKGNWGIIITND
jgi:SAM-dependent methyltransferase